MDVAVLEFFATPDVVDALESNLAEMHPQEMRLADLVALAWQVRQRNTRRALALADEAQALLATTPLAPHAQTWVQARLMLVRAEAQWLFADLAGAQSFASAAWTRFESLDDAIGCADVYWSNAMCAHDRGDAAGRNTALEAMARLAAPP